MRMSCVASGSPDLSPTSSQLSPYTAGGEVSWNQQVENGPGSSGTAGPTQGRVGGPVHLGLQVRPLFVATHPQGGGRISVPFKRTSTSSPSVM